MRTHRRLAIGLVLLALNGILALAVLPPWQFPDEPRHVEFVRILATTHPLNLEQRIDIPIEQAILRSMRDHQWWEHVGLQAPETLPPYFAETPIINAAGEGGVPQSPPLYYVWSAVALRLAGIGSLEGQYEALRVQSLLVCALALVCCHVALLGTGLSDAEQTLLLGWIALQPMFVLTATAAHPDAFSALFGAAGFAGLLWVWRGGRAGAVGLAALAASAVLALLTKRSAAPLVPVFLLGLALFLRDRRRSLRQRTVIAALLAACACGAFVLLRARAAAEFGRVVTHTLGALSSITGAAAGRASDPAFAGEFFQVLVDSFWMRAGWMAYTPPDWAVWAMRVLTLAGLAGVPVAVIRRGDGPRGPIALSVVVAGTFVAALLATYFASGQLAQGRYLMPALLPLLIALWAGQRALWPQRWPSAGLLAATWAVAVVFAAASWPQVVAAYLR